jgi:hypothetical protein
MLLENILPLKYQYLAKSGEKCKLMARFQKINIVGMSQIDLLCILPSVRMLTPQEP